MLGSAVKEIYNLQRIHREQPVSLKHEKYNQCGCEAETLIVLYLEDLNKHG